MELVFKPYSDPDASDFYFDCVHGQIESALISSVKAIMLKTDVSQALIELEELAKIKPLEKCNYPSLGVAALSSVSRYTNILKNVYQMLLMQSLAPTPGVPCEMLNRVEEHIEKVYQSYVDFYCYSIEKTVAQMRLDLENITKCDTGLTMSEKEVAVLQTCNNKVYTLYKKLHELKTDNTVLRNVGLTYAACIGDSFRIKQMHDTKKVSDDIYAKLCALLLRKYRDLCVHFTTNFKDESRAQLETIRVSRFKLTTPSEMDVFLSLKQFILGQRGANKAIKMMSIALSLEAQQVLRQVDVLPDGLERFTAFFNGGEDATQTAKSIKWVETEIYNCLMIEFD